MKKNLVLDDLHNEIKNIKNYKGVEIQAHKIQNIRENSESLEVYCKGGRWLTYKKNNNVWELKIDTRWY